MNPDTLKPLLAVFGIFVEFILAKSTYILVMGFLIDVYKIKNACVHRYLSFFTSIIDFRLQHVTYLLLLGKNSFAPKICFYSVDNTSLAWGLVAFRGLTHWCDIDEVWWLLEAQHMDVTLTPRHTDRVKTNILEKNQNQLKGF